MLLNLLHHTDWPPTTKANLALGIKNDKIDKG